MVKYLYLVFLLFGTACSEASNVRSNAAIQCEISINKPQTCHLDGMRIHLETKKVEDDEYLLSQLTATLENKSHSLAISDQVSMLDGDIGFIRIEDINFDGALDIGITTSFGTSNLYLDYWVYDTHQKEFHYIGNYSIFSLDASTKTIHTNTKKNAAHYDKKTYSWNGLSLSEQ